MTDLVKRLRDWQHVYPEDQDKHEGHLYEEAADRIEELEAEVELLKKKEVEEVMWRECHIEELEAENKALCKALWNISVKEESVTLGTYDDQR